MQIMSSTTKYLIDYAIHVMGSNQWWAYLVFIYCFFAGLKSLHPQVVSYYRIFVVPVLITIWSILTIFLRYPLTAAHISASFAAAIIGTFGGWKIYQFAPVRTDKQKKLIQVPGSFSTLISILLIFFFRYFFGHFEIINPANVTDPFFIFSDLIISALIIGFILGKGFYYFYAYQKSHHTSLWK